MQIKCYDKGCSCSTKKRDHFKKYSWKKRHYASPKKRFSKKKNWKFLRRKQFREKTSKVCFVCRRPGHFAKNCPKKEKAAKLLEQDQIHVEDNPFSDVESLFSLDDEYSPQALVVMAYSTSEEDTDLDNDEDSELEIQTIYTSQSIIAPLTNPTPIAQVHILLDTYSRLIPVIALFDIGVAATILHPKILPAECWLPHNQMFRAANGETFLITLKSKPLLIRIFPTLIIRHQVLGSPLAGRDLLIGFDLLHQIPNL